MFTSYSFYIDEQDDAAPPLPDDRTRRLRTPTMRTRTTGRHLDEESSVGPDRGPAAIVDADEADAVIGDGALAGVTGAPVPAPLAAIIPAKDSAADSMYGGHG